MIRLVGSIVNPQRFYTTTLHALPCGEAASRIMAAALTAVEPMSAVHTFLRREGDHLSIADQHYDLGQIRNVVLVGAGKAGRPMAAAVAEVLGDRLTAGIVVVPDASFDPVTGVELLLAGHPIPDMRSLVGAQRIADLLAKTCAEDLVIALISGGGSALLSLPPQGLDLADLQDLTGHMLACGATINEINVVRKHLDTIKGGGLARMAYPSTLVTLVLSDVVGSPLDSIASGPTVADPSSFADALAVLEKYQLCTVASTAVLRRLQSGVSGEVADTPGPADPCFQRALTLVVGNNPQAARAAAAAAQAAGFHTQILTTYLQGEAREVGRFLAAIGRELALEGQPLPRPACIIVGGETTVTLRSHGRGGRNQEMALAAVEALAGLPNIALITLATDGGDGPTDAAGAVVTGETLARAQRLGLNPITHLAQHNAYPFFAALDDLLRPGPTETNVNDLAFLLTW